MLHLIIAVLGIALLLYLLFGGADFGAGILELFSKKRDMANIKSITYQAIGPVWEANHIWIILVVVILFMGFPKIYSTLSIALHIPIMLMLLGIILRGTTFTFRHYDAIKDGTEKYYSIIFAYSSFFTPMFLGIIAGATISGKIDLTAPDFYGRFIAGWFNWFSFSTGLFTSAICAYLAAIFLIGEASNDKTRNLFIKRAKLTALAMVVSGGIVLLTATLQGIPLFKDFWQHPVGIGCLLLATATLPVLISSLKKQNAIALQRITAGFQITLILLAWLWIHYPDIIKLSNGEHLGFYNTKAPPATLNALGIALIAGVAIIMPLLFFLFKTFNKLQGNHAK